MRSPAPAATNVAVLQPECANPCRKWPSNRGAAKWLQASSFKEPRRTFDFVSFQELTMKRELSVIRSAVAVAMLIGVSGLARADGSSMNPFTGDSYAFFNGGCNIQQRCKPVFDNAPSAFRQSNPHGLSESQLQAIAVEGPTRDFTPAILDRDASTWRT